MSPGDIIKKKLHEKGWTQRDLAQILGRALPNINEIINGKTAITPETAIQLAQAFGDHPEEWLLSESRCRLSLLEEDDAVSKRARLYDLAPIKEMEQRSWIASTDSIEGLELELKSFFGVDSLDSDPQVAVSTRRSDIDSMLNPAQRAWCFRAIQLAKALPAEKFCDKAFNDGLSTLRLLAAIPDEIRKVPRVLAKMGIRFVVIEPLKKTRIDGAALWLDDESPVIAVSLRFDRLDSFWHTLAHELSHIRHRDSTNVDVDLVGEDRCSPAELDQIELRADREAAAMWVDASAMEEFIKRTTPLYSRSKIVQFANRIKMHPAIIVGQLQYRGEIAYAAHRNLHEKVRERLIVDAMTDGWGHSGIS